MICLFGIVTTIHSNLVYAVSSEKILLVQQYEQFPGQEITGFCNVAQDDEGNLHWMIKVNGLVPETRGHFDLGHWAGEVDVPYTADDSGKTDSQNQIVLEANVPNSLFSQFTKCQVHISGYNHFTSPVIALGVSNSNGADVNEIKKPIPIEEKFFLFEALEYVFGILTNNNSDPLAGFNSVFGPPSPSKNPSTTDKGPTDKGPTDKGPTDKGPTDKGPTDKGPTDKGPTDKGPTDKGPTDKDSENNGGNPKKCNPAQQKKGLC